MAGHAVYLSRDDLLRIHSALIERHGGMPGVLDEGRLDSCLAQPKTNVFGVERFPTFIEKAAAYCFFLARNHPFYEGNKRTAFVAALHFLRINGVGVWFNEDEAYQVILGAVKGERTLEDLATMISRAVERARRPLEDGPSNG